MFHATTNLSYKHLLHVRCLIPFAGNICKNVRWSDYSSAAYSVADVAANCPDGTCAQCDWWPLRSAAPFYYAPINCRYTLEWTDCNVTCGIGNMLLKRVRVKVPAANGGTCPYPDGYIVDAQISAECQVTDCPVDCEGTWSPWSACDNACGDGTRSRTYTITTTAVNGGEACMYTDGLVQIKNCTSWFDNCTLPAAMVAAQCTPGRDGILDVSSTCNCTDRTYPRTFTPFNNISAAINESCLLLVDPELCPSSVDLNCTGQWVWDTCNVTCGGGTQAGGYITQPAGDCGTPCATANGTTDSRACNIDPCPAVDCVGNWTSWGDWDSCNATCGGGWESRAFIITTEAAYGGQACTQANNTVEWQACSTNPCPVNCTGDWTAWGSCNATCGGGNETREYLITTAAAYNGTDCPYTNNTLDYRPCAPNPCPVDCIGNWTAWGDLDACNATCGGGWESRAFIITTEAAYGGQTCTQANNTVEWQACATTDCPGHCVGSWTAWDSCNATCGGGQQSRVFYVIHDASHNGTVCDAVNGTVGWQACNTSPCPMACIGSWGAWGACSAECDGGQQTRTFTITTPAAHGGVSCNWTNGELGVQDCNTQACTPQQGAAECPSDLVPVVFMPQGTAVADLPVLVTFPNDKSKEAYCPYTAGATR
jgi:hypothetical protein